MGTQKSGRQPCTQTGKRPNAHNRPPARHGSGGELQVLYVGLSELVFRERTFGREDGSIERVSACAITEEDGNAAVHTRSSRDAVAGGVVSGVVSGATGGGRCRGW